MANDSKAMTDAVQPVSAGRRSPFEVRDRVWRWILLLPAVLIVVLLLAIPILWTLYAAFTDLHLYRQGIETSWVGFANFQKLMRNQSFWRTVRNTVVFMLGVVPLQLLIGIVIALCLNNITRGRKFFRTWFLMPLMISPVVVAFIVGRMLFQEDIGPINSVLRSLGFEGVPWFTHPTWAMVSLILIDVWHGIAFKGFVPESFRLQRRYHEAWVSSPLLKTVYEQQYGFAPDRVQDSGYARVDRLFRGEPPDSDIRQAL